jgi:glycosyltransferase involved in cell wall biosynthesis
MPGLRAVIYGEGPERPEVLSAIAVHGLEEFVKAPGFVDGSVIQNALSRALCLVLPSRREGYGLVVLEAMSRGTPTILTEGDDNASVEFIVEGVNGFLASSAGPEELAAAITLVQEGGLDLRRSTLDSFNGSLKRRGLARSLQEITTAYEEEPSADS